MNKRCWQWVMVLVCILVLSGYTHTATGSSSKNERITCSDGEEFLLEEWRSLETAEIPIIKNEKIVIDTQRLRLTFYRDDQIVKSYPVAIGDPETPTPVGEWKIIHKGGNWGDGFGVRWMGLNVPWGIYGIHGTNKPYTIGSRASHGCIRMFNFHVLELYNMVKVGTPVYITGKIRKVPLRWEMYRKSAGEDVLRLQFALREMGLNSGRADARYQAETERAVLQLQYYYGLAPTGKTTYNEQYLLGLRPYPRGE